MNNLKEFIFFHLQNFYTQDWLILGCSFLIFIFFILLIILLLRFASLCVLLIIICIFTDIAFFYYAKDLVDKKYRNREFVVLKDYKMMYSDNLYILYKLSNNSKHNFSICKLNYTINTPSKNYLEKIKKIFKPFKSETIIIKDLKKNEYVEKELIIKNIKINNYKLSYNSVCY
ncbi:DUF2393 family protein [Campylobacter canadensis]|uniref:DUF2393 family protein n=1 Tax=Campylobacter canadensis TaxID=449520 RepID=A0ABS7WSD5_9BACT|nr:DUF2393 family protein [Campylobacter canadensis]MBZ7986859.1 DUF2393 family protein [Campylobacter canadensis]MBZ7994180.1 DUF2393 family protein [Campylobacter canadensis]MBZ7995827.1 DUF2393 family protein [Campylobacter canadensis]MBZ7997896.1 DUF2393 family protein [Campylobacter canadensis]MBZ7999512.1 DUF2393 family protein [Campylobacter canadensis]